MTAPSISAQLGDDWTTDFDSIKCYDQLKVNAVVNWINGKNHLGTGKAPVPVIFGMNFQAVSVGQKLIEPIRCQGPTQTLAVIRMPRELPRPSMASGDQFVDAAIGQMVAALKHQGLLDSTTIIITAKHGQSPIDPNRFFPIPGNSGNNGSRRPESSPNFSRRFTPTPLTVSGSPKMTFPSFGWRIQPTPVNAVTASGECNAATVGLGQIFYGASLTHHL